MSNESAPDSARTENPTPEMPSSGKLILTLVIIAMLSGFTVVFAYQATIEPIARNHRERLGNAIFEVLPDAQRRVNYALTEEGLREIPDENIDDANIYAGYDGDGRLVGVAMAGSARGYADEIRVLYGYSPADECIVGFTVLASNETPGLGAKIATDPGFLANFACLDVRLNEDQSALRNELRAVRPGTEADEWEIDSLTGATVSSQAVGRALRESVNRMLPLLHRHLDELGEEGN